MERIEASAGPQPWPIFICYRRDDGRKVAAYLHEILNGWQTRGPEGEPIELDVYLDEDMPGVADWTKLHRPYLELAEAMIVVCTPAAKINEGPDDWVHKEIDWWLTHRDAAPILTDPLKAGARYVPEQITERWPDIQRLVLPEDFGEDLPAEQARARSERFRRKIVGAAILPSGARVMQQKLEIEQKRVRELRSALTRSRVLLGGLSVALVIALLAVSFALQQQRLAERQTQVAVSRQLAAQSQAVFEEQPLLGLQLSLESFARIPGEDEQTREFVGRGIRDIASRGRLATLGQDVMDLSASDAPEWVIVASRNDLGEILNFDDARQITPLTGTVSSVNFSPNDPLFVVHYEDAPGEVRFVANLEQIVPLAGIVENAFFGPDDDFFVVNYEDARSEMLEAEPTLSKRVDLGLGLSESVFDASEQRLALRYSDGRSYLLDLAWLSAMGGNPETLTLERLRRLACEGPLSQGLVLAEELTPFLPGETPSACSNDLHGSTLWRSKNRPTAPYPHGQAILTDPRGRPAAPRRYAGP